MSDLPVVNEENFKSQVLESKVPVLVEFGAEWCAPCKQMEPVLRQLAATQWAGKMRLVQVNVDDSVSLTTSYRVMGVPTVILFVQGQPKERLSGYQPKDKLVAKFAPHLG